MRELPLNTKKMEQRYKNIYDWMLQKDELFDFMPKASGDWEQDKVKFIFFQIEMEKLANLTDIDLEQLNISQLTCVIKIRVLYLYNKFKNKLLTSSYIVVRL